MSSTRDTTRASPRASLLRKLAEQSPQRHEALKTAQRKHPQNGDLARRLEAALADRQAIKTQLSMLQAQIHGLQAEVQSLAAAAAATSGGGGGPPGELMMPPPGSDAIV